jgi:hypothetical protein
MSYIIYDVIEESINDLKESGLESYIQPTLFDERIDIIVIGESNACRKSKAKSVHSQ